MPIIAKGNKKDFTPAPEGLWPAVCIDVVDLGMLKSQWGEAHKVQLRWALEEIDPKTDKPFMVVKPYTLSLHEKANLRRELETWRGRKFTAQETEGFDLEKLIGVNCQLQIMHSAKDEGDVYANIQAIVPAAKGVVKIPIPSDYIRVCDRTKEAKPADSFEATDEDIPF
jgi:hypothetical protein